jgi:hypothetical protein
MKGRKKAVSFRKTVACPSSSMLLSYTLKKLSPEVSALIKYHLRDCEFCASELPLLAHHKQPPKPERAPEIPMNLRILAESIMCQNSKSRIIG